MLALVMTDGAGAMVVSVSAAAERDGIGDSLVLEGDLSGEGRHIVKTTRK
ncbi:hypothetical protein [Bradyrhizobium tunisiense]